MISSSLDVSGHIADRTQPRIALVHCHYGATPDHHVVARSSVSWRVREAGHALGQSARQCRIGDSAPLR